jgi:predicted metalloprotease with PDZ domain
VVRLERIKDLADRFVRVRLTRIDGADLNLFEFDYDLTFMVFFLDAREKVYARYGGRDARGPDELQSLAGLRYTMNSVLEMHRREGKAYAPRDKEGTRYARQLAGARTRRCLHCHQVREALNDELERAGRWDRSRVWRYPLPDNLGLTLEVDRGNVVKRVGPGTPAARAGLQAGDVLRRLNGVPIHSLADAQFALDRAEAKGAVGLAWERRGKEQTGTLALPEGWRKSDITWRPSLRGLVPTLPLYGTDLTAAEKKALGLPAKQTAFRQRTPVHSRAEAAGFRAGDVILGIAGKDLPGIDAAELRDHVRREYLDGDRVEIDVLRDGKRLRLPFTLR